MSTASGGALCDSSVTRGQLASTGAAGSVLYALLLALVVWRIVVLWRASAWGASGQKTLFHFFLLLSCALELPYYLVLAKTHCYSKPAFSLHLLAVWSDLVAFSMVIVLWSRALALVKDKDLLMSWVVGLDSFALVYTLVVVSLVIGE